jgi:hypothetical protein
LVSSSQEETFGGVIAAVSLCEVDSSRVLLTAFDAPADARENGKGGEMLVPLPLGPPPTPPPMLSDNESSEQRAASAVVSVRCGR